MLPRPSPFNYILAGSEARPDRVAGVMRLNTIVHLATVRMADTSITIATVNHLIAEERQLPLEL